MAVTYQTNAVATTTSASALSTGSITPGASLPLILADIEYSDAVTIAVNSVDWAGEALAFLAWQDDPTTNVAVELWYKARPTTLTGAVTVNMSGTATYLCLNATWLNGTHASSPLGASGAGSNIVSPTSLTVVGTNAAGLQVHATAVHRGTSGTILTVIAGPIEIHNDPVGGSGAKRVTGAACFIASAVGAVTAGFTESVNRNWGALQYEILPSTAAIRDLLRAGTVVAWPR